MMKLLIKLLGVVLVLLGVASISQDAFTSVGAIVIGGAILII